MRGRVPQPASSSRRSGASTSDACRHPGGLVAIVEIKFTRPLNHRVVLRHRPMPARWRRCRFLTARPSRAAKRTPTTHWLISTQVAIPEPRRRTRSAIFTGPWPARSGQRPARQVEYKLRIDDVCSAAPCVRAWGPAAALAQPPVLRRGPRRSGRGAWARSTAVGTSSPSYSSCWTRPADLGLFGHEADVRRAVGLRGPLFGF